MIKKLLVAVPLALTLVLAALPGAALAKGSTTPVDCTFTLFVTDQGADEVKAKKKHIEVKNSGQTTIGFLDCGAPTFDPLLFNPFKPLDDLIDVPDHPLDGIVTTLHGSKVKVDQGSDTFEGKLKGDITLFSILSGTLTGKIKAKVSGSGLLGGLEGLVETITGKVNLKGTDIKAKGEFSITLVAVDVNDDEIPDTLAGVGTLTGELK